MCVCVCVSVCSMYVCVSRNQDYAGKLLENLCMNECMFVRVYAGTEINTMPQYIYVHKQIDTHTYIHMPHLGLIQFIFDHVDLSNNVYVSKYIHR
jgi:hypothetical protein